jgi:hypothetical protein
MPDKCSQDETIGSQVKGELWRVREEDEDEDNGARGREALSSCWSSEYKSQFL